MASSVIHHDLNVIFKNVTTGGVVTFFNSKLVRQAFTITTDALGHAEIPVIYHHTLACDVLGQSVFVTTKKSGISGNNNLVVELRDSSGALIINASYDVIVTYLDY